MNELSVFADESGNFDFNKHHSRYYIVSLVFHDQSIDITKNIRVLNDKTKHLGQSDSCFHAGPLIRREDEYQYMSVEDRVRIFNAFYNFTRTADVKYHAIVVDKNVYKNKTTLILQILKRLSQFLDAHIEMFDKYDRVIVYYDNGQREIKEMLATAFDKALNNAEFRNVTPNDYKLFQTADMICTLELLSTKAEHNKKFSNSEIKFFISPKKFDKDYYRAIKRKMIQ